MIPGQGAIRRPLRVLLILVFVAAAGCGGSHTSWFSGRSSRETLETALEDRRPDERRKAVAALERSGDASASWATKAFDTIARTDSDPMVRVEAVRGLAHSAAPGTVGTLVKLINSASTPLADVNPAAPGPVRWEAAALLERFSAEGKITQADRESVLSAFIARVNEDPDRNVRLTSILALRHYRDRRVFPALVGALRTRDYAIQHRAEQSLHALTAQHHDRDADAWDRWLASTAEPFVANKPAPDTRPWWARLTARK